MKRWSKVRVVLVMIAMLTVPAWPPVATAAAPPPDATRTAARERLVVVEGTREAAPGLPVVHVQLRERDRVLTAEPSELERLLEGDGPRLRSFPAYLDTGSSSIVIGRATAERFGVVAVKGAAYHEVGLHGDVRMGVTAPYDVTLLETAGDGDDRGDAETLLRRAAMQINLAEPASGLLALVGSVDVVGMPAIEKLLIEIEPAARRERGRKGGDALDELLGQYEDLVAAPRVSLHERRPRHLNGRAPRGLVVPLESMDFNRRRHPENAGPRPELAKNLLVPAVVTEDAGATFTGDWLLDTGASASVVSVGQAQALGLIDADGAPARDPDFTLTLGGIGGNVAADPGFVIDRLRVQTTKRDVLEFRDVHVIVRDIAIELDSGERRVLAGVFGMNLLLPSINGAGAGQSGELSDPPFARIWIDGRRERLVLERAED